VRLQVLALILIVLAAIAAGQYAMDHWTDWNAQTKASAWVAAGTIALASATFWSVLQTLNVIRGEDRRHQQGYAPFLLLGDSINNGEEYNAGYTLKNKGDGIALNITFQIRGQATVATFRFPPDVPGFTDIEKHKAFLEEHKTLVYHELVDTESLSASFPGGWDTFSQEVFRKPPGNLAELEDVIYSFCLIQYNDVFGNPYETRYTDDRLDRYEWIQPQSLRIPKA
jgi:hypothetical protein